MRLRGVLPRARIGELMACRLAHLAWCSARAHRGRPGACTPERRPIERCGGRGFVVGGTGGMRIRWRPWLSVFMLLVGVVTLSSCGMLPRSITASEFSHTPPSPAATANPPPGSLAYLDAKNGFRDLTFGDPPPAGMLPVEEDGDTRVYL